MAALIRLYMLRHGGENRPICTGEIIYNYLKYIDKIFMLILLINGFTYALMEYIKYSDRAK